jgi:hypothetical protein
MSCRVPLVVDWTTKGPQKVIDLKADAYESTPGAEDGPSSIRGGRSRLLRGSVLVSLLVLVAVLVWSGTALADSASISVTNTAGESDPAAGLARVFTLSGTASIPEYAFVKYRAPGGAPCAPNAAEDTGSPLAGTFDSPFWEAQIEGTFSIRNVMTWEPPGTVMFCIWLAKGEREIVSPITQTISFRSPRGTISATVNPLTPAPGQTATVTVTGSSEAPERVYAKIRPAGGAPCAPTYEADTGENLIEGSAVNGAYSMQTTTTQTKAGQYLICLWMASSGKETPAIAGPQPETFTVASPPPPPPPPPPRPPCVVPSFNSKMHLSTVERRIRAAHCRVGKISYSSSERYRHGAVIKLSHRSGTRLSSNAAVGVLVSSGRPRHHKR